MPQTRQRKARGKAIPSYIAQGTGLGGLGYRGQQCCSGGQQWLQWVVRPSGQRHREHGLWLHWRLQ